jgi:hypothetical protein
MRPTLLLFFCLFAGLCSADNGPLPKASASPANVDPELDCDLRALAWDYARKLLPLRGEFTSVYDALQLENCKAPSAKEHEPRPFTHTVSLTADALAFYVDAASGNDSNPGTLNRPVKTIMQAVKLSRAKSGQQRVIYLRRGTYYLTETINLGTEDSNLVISGYPEEVATVSGGREYKFDWVNVVDEMGPIMPGVNAIYGAVSAGGQSTGAAWFYGIVDNAIACQMACIKNSSCFAYTWHDTTTGSFSNCCYFRIDGLWEPYPQSGHYSGKKLRIYSADLSAQNPKPFNTLFINGRRSIRARYPDGNPETMGLHTTPTGYVSKAQSWVRPKEMPPAKEIHIESPIRNGTHFPQFEIGIGGPVAAFDPPESYWGLKSPTGGGGSTYKITTGLVYSTDEEFANRTWSNPRTGIVHTFHCGHWGNWQFQVDSRDMGTQTILFSRGGHQEARGCSSGAEWYIENIMEELDAPNEWFYDETREILYYFPNSSSFPDSGIGTLLDQLFAVEGTQDAPVTQVTFTNLTFAHTASTFLEKYEVPSAGDWAIHRGGAVFVEGVDGLLVQNCLFFSPGGNGLFLSNYIRNAVIEGNEFIYTGDSAIAAVGTADLIDGTLGNQPRGTQILGNLVHEIGIWGKETSAYFQSVACQTTIRGNVFFNGPRAGINFNDGFGGGNLVENNLLFNMVRETGDHGPFNSWDRQPYLTAVRNGNPSLTPAQSNITRNFIINNYHSTWPLDHDDGSCYYYDTYNYLVYGGYKNYLGHSKVVKYNYYIYPDVDLTGLGTIFQKPYCANSDGASRGSLPSGWGEVWANNTCIIGNPNIYDFGSCTSTGSNAGLIPLTANNAFFAPNEYIYIECGGTKWSLEEFQAMGYDVGSSVHEPVSYTTIIQWGRNLLWI